MTYQYQGVTYINRVALIAAIVEQMKKVKK